MKGDILFCTHCKQFSREIDNTMDSRTGKAMTISSDGKIRPIKGFGNHKYSPRCTHCKYEKTIVNVNQLCDDADDIMHNNTNGLRNWNQKKLYKLIKSLIPKKYKKELRL